RAVLEQGEKVRHRIPRQRLAHACLVQRVEADEDGAARAGVLRHLRRRRRLRRLRARACAGDEERCNEQRARSAPGASIVQRRPLRILGGSCAAPGRRGPGWLRARRDSWQGWLAGGCHDIVAAAPPFGEERRTRGPPSTSTRAHWLPGSVVRTTMRS